MICFHKWGEPFNNVDIALIDESGDRVGWKFLFSQRCSRCGIVKVRKKRS